MTIRDILANESMQNSDRCQYEPTTRIAAALFDAGIAMKKAERVSTITQNAETVLKRRYLSKDRNGNIVEDVDGMFRRVAYNLSQADLLYDDSEESRKHTEETFFDVMRYLELLPNSPTLMNAGRELQQLSGCFVLPVEDSLEGIFETVKQTALIHKSGGGTGFAFSRVRPAGDVVGSTGGVASGPVSFIRNFDAATDTVKQGGTRRGANMAILNVTHPDILAFIRSKENGDALKNFNISVGVTSEFMEHVKHGEDYDLINPRTDQVSGQLNAKEVFDLLVEMAWKTGDPGLVFMDTINRDNPNPQLGVIESTNPCGEQPLLPYESCNLASINLARMTYYDNDVMNIDWDKLQDTIGVAVHLLDNVIDMNSYPIPEIEAMSKKTRRIGLGVMGFSDLLVQLGVPYDSQDGLELIDQVMKFVRMYTHQKSMELAEIRGTFPAWEGSIYKNRDNPKPMRNSAPVTIAPTGTISIIAGASSGIEPMFALAYERNVMDNTRLTECNPYFEAVAKYEGFYSDELMRSIASTGSLEHVDVPTWVKRVFRVSHDIDFTWHVRMQGEAQRYTDNAVSKTINFPHTATVTDVERAYMLAYGLGCKGITIYRDGSKDDQVLSVGKTVTQEIKQEIAHLSPRERPRSIKGMTEMVQTGHGNMYVTINYDEKDQPFEVFGNLGKAGGCDSAQLEALTRMISLGLRSGIDPHAIIEQLNGITCCPAWDNGVLIKSTPDSVALVLGRYVDAYIKKASLPAMKIYTNGNNNNGTGRRCSDCNNPVIYQEGCLICRTCGWSKCE